MKIIPLFNGLSDDPEFNAEAARKAYSMVMKMDEDSARTFTTMVTAEILWNDIAKNQRTLQRHLDDVVAKRMVRVQKSMERIEKRSSELISKRLTPVGMPDFTSALATISKAVQSPYDHGYIFRETEHPRSGGGQFRTKIHNTARKPVKDNVARSMPGMPSVKSTKGLNDRQKAVYQQGYSEVAQFLDTVANSGLLADSRTFVTVRERGAGGRTYVVETNGSKPPAIDPSTEEYAAIETRPTGLTVGGAGFGLVSALGGGPGQARQVGATANEFDRNLGTFANDFTSAGYGSPSSNARLYGRVESGSRFLGQVAPAGSKLQIAAQFGEFIGRQGPQAEKVLGPHARATLYRYRGTEKAPDQELTTTFNRMSRPLKTDPTDAAAKYRADKFAQDYFLEKLPERGLYDLQLKSGHTPPSEGVIIDKDGKIVTQAIGYSDDHYLPFNLKNLRGLRGGEYIRTRSVGGPTTEDIYTGLISGAKSITVVSRSGTFKIDFDDTFRGTRRYNDKAGRMVDRYGKLLDAVKSEQVERQQLDPSVRLRIAREVNQEMAGFASPKEIRREIGRRETEFKENPSLTPEDEQRIQTRIADIPEGRDRDRVEAILRNNLLESKEYNFRLNGEGYKAAITALEEQFPYYIKRASFLPRDAEREFAGAKDRGYVKPRHNRPEGALAGYYDPSIAGAGSLTGTGKTPADRVDYQNFHVARGDTSGTLTAVEQESASAIPTATGTLNAAATPAEIAADKISRAQDQATEAETAWKLNQAVAARTAGETTAFTPMGAMDEQTFKKWYAAPGNQSTFSGLVDSVLGTNAAAVKEFGGPQGLITQYHAARGLAGGVMFNRANHLGTVPDQPYRFPGAPYMRGGSIEKKQKELAQVAHRSKLPDFGSLADLQDDADFKEALKKAQDIRVIADQVREMDPDEAANFLMALTKTDPSFQGMSPAQRKIVASPEKADQLVEDVNRAWALRHNITRMADAQAAMAQEDEAGRKLVEGVQRAKESGEAAVARQAEKASRPLNVRNVLPTQPDLQSFEKQRDKYLSTFRELSMKMFYDDHEGRDEAREVADAFDAATTPEDLEIAKHDMNAFMARHPDTHAFIGHRLSRGN